MKRIFVTLMAMTFSLSAFALDGFRCEQVGDSSILTIKLLDDENASVNEKGADNWSTSARYNRRVLSDSPHMAFSTFYLETGRAIEIMEDGEETTAVMVLSNYNLRIYECEAINR